MQTPGKLSADQQTRLDGLQQKLNADRTTYAELTRNLTDVGTQAARLTDSLVIVSPAELPQAPVSPNPLRNAVLALAAGLLVALGIALLLEHLDQSIRSEKDLTERLGGHTIGHLLKSRGGGDLVVLQGHNPAAESYKTLRTNLLFSTIDQEVKTILITSAMPAEGKSWVSSNLAASLAVAGHKVLLIDADFRRPSQQRIFKRLRNVGLANMIVADMPEAELISLWMVCRTYG